MRDIRGVIIELAHIMLEVPLSTNYSWRPKETQRCNSSPSQKVYRPGRWRCNFQPETHGLENWTLLSGAGEDGCPVPADSKLAILCLIASCFGSHLAHWEYITSSRKSDSNATLSPKHPHRYPNNVFQFSRIILLLKLGLQLFTLSENCWPNTL